MGEILLLLQSPGELRQAPAAAPAVVAELAEKRFAGCAGKVFFQPCRPVEVDQRLVLTDAQWDCPDTFLPKPPVQAPQKVQQVLPCLLYTSPSPRD